MTLLAAAIAFVAMLITALLQGSKPFYYDAAIYWELAGSFTRDGPFSLLAFDSSLRGYLLPLVYHLAHEIGSSVGATDATIVMVFNAAVFAAIATVLAPKLAMLAWPQTQWGLGRRLAVAALLAVFWRGYLNFPLSDFPALAAVLLSLIAVARVDAPAWMLTAGVAAGAAINMRPAYLLLVPVLIVLVGLAWFDQRGTPPAWARRGLCCGLLVAGFAAVSLPQSLSAHRHHDTWSFVPGAAAQLSSLQFTEGLRMQRYETFVGSGQPGPRMVFQDPTGGRILAEQPDGVIEDAGEYLGVIVANPVEMAGVFARHLINGLDQRYSTPYVEQLDDGSNRWLRLSGFLIVFLALLRVAWPAARHSLGTARWRYPLALLACGSSSLASAVEARFLLPAAITAYVLVVAPDWPSPLRSPGDGVRRLRVPALALVAFVAFMAVVLTVIGDATDQLVLTP